MGNALMPTDENRVFTAIGLVQGQLTSLSDKVDEYQTASTEEHRKVHQIVDALSEAMRNQTRLIEEMKPLTDDYRERRAEQRGEDRYKNWLYGLAASIGGLVVLILSKTWDVIAARPHP